MTARAATLGDPAPAGRPAPYAFPGFERHIAVQRVGPRHRAGGEAAVGDAAGHGRRRGGDRPAGSEGLAHLTARALIEGRANAMGRSSRSTRNDLAPASRPAPTGIRDRSNDSPRVPARRRDSAARRRAHGAHAAGARSSDCKGERLAELLQLRAEPRGLADETLDRVVYADARYARPAGGTETSVAALSRERSRMLRRTTTRRPSRSWWWAMSGRAGGATRRGDVRSVAGRGAAGDAGARPAGAGRAGVCTWSPRRTHRSRSFASATWESRGRHPTTFR